MRWRFLGLILKGYFVKPQFSVGLFSSLALCSALSFAEPLTTQQSDTKIGLVLGFAVGGDTLVNVSFDDGSSESVTAGGGVLFGASIEKNLNLDTAYPMFAEFAFNYQTDSVDAENGSVSFTRFPIDALLSTKIDKFALGAGLTYHLSPTLESDGFLNVDVNYDDAIGTILNATYHMTNDGVHGILWGLRFTQIDYQGAGLYQQNGSNVTFTMGAKF